MLAADVEAIAVPKETQQVRVARPSHVPALDGLRGLAVILVMMTHANTLMPRGPAWRPVIVTMNLGWSGVELFFVLSGFLITRILLANTARERGMTVFKRFYAKRVLRIFPLYYVALLGILAVRYLLNVDFGPSGKELAWYLLYLQNWYNAGGHIPVAVGHLWSLAIEEQFYLIWPVVVVLCTPRQLQRVCVAAIAIGIALRLVLMATGLGGATWLYHATVTHLDGLAMGALVATFELEGTLPRIRSGPIVAVGTLSLAALVIVSRSSAMWGEMTPFAVMAPSAFSVLFMGLMVTILQHPGARGDRALRSLPLTEAGRLSYALYVFHPLVLWGMDRLVRPTQPAWYESATLIVLFATVTVLLAMASWRYVEEPFLRLKASI